MAQHDTRIIAVVGATGLQGGAVTNPDRYGSPPLPWSRAHDLPVANPAQPSASYVS